jgi:hypothetical protein
VVQAVRATASPASITLRNRMVEILLNFVRLIAVYVRRLADLLRRMECFASANVRFIDGIAFL